MNLVPRNSCPKLSNFSWYFTQLGKFRGKANDEKHADPGKKNQNCRKSRENSRNLLEAFLRSRKEENLYGHCDMNNARRILSKGSTFLRGCWFWSKTLHFQKNFGRNFIAVEGATQEIYHNRTHFLYLNFYKMIARAFWKLSQFSKRMIARAFWKLSQFSKRHAISVQRPGSNFRTSFSWDHVSVKYAAGVQCSRFEILTVCM